MHVPTYLLALHNFQPLFNRPFFCECKTVDVTETFKGYMKALQPSDSNLLRHCINRPIVC